MPTWSQREGTTRPSGLDTDGITSDISRACIPTLAIFVFFIIGDEFCPWSFVRNKH